MFQTAAVLIAILSTWLPVVEGIILDIILATSNHLHPIADFFGAIDAIPLTIGVTSTYTFTLFDFTAKTVPATSNITISFPPANYASSNLPTTPTCNGVYSIASM
jgi:hypothetical protein